LLIVNADDFGRSSGINRGVAEGHERGIVTSASLMVRWPASVEAAEYAREHPRLSLGLHVDLGEWAYRPEAEEWVRVYQVVPENDPSAVAEAVAMQLTTFRQLSGRDPTHLDSHQHVHRNEPVRSVLRHVARAVRVPLRQCSSQIRYCGNFYGQTEEGAPFLEGITVDNLLRILTDLRPGSTELGCHPGLGDDIQSTYRRERILEVRALCDARVRTALKELGIELRSFALPPRAYN
jgi:predicted glycoside hydrolase/deacetylase ChbG (UPF0249 family)